MDKYKTFLTIARELNKIGITPLLYGSLGLERRLRTDLAADDIDILIPHSYLGEKWSDITSLMNGMGYELYDLHEHAFKKDGLSTAFASIEELESFANIDISKIPEIEENPMKFLLLDLPDYFKVYKASSKDGYRVNKKSGKDFAKIELLKNEIAGRLTFKRVIDGCELNDCLDVIQKSFITVANEFGLTKENCPSHTAFITLDTLKRHLTEGKAMFLLKYEDTPAGYFSLCKNNTVFELNHLAVLPEFRHCAFGEKIINKAKETAKIFGGEKLTLSIIEENEILKKWYADKGFLHTETKKFPHLPFTVGFMEIEL